LQADQLLRERSYPIDVTAGPTKVHPQVAAIGPTQTRKRLRERREARLPPGIIFVVRHEHADAPDAAALLRPRREWPCGRAAEHSDEFAPSKANLHLPLLCEEALWKENSTAQACSPYLEEQGHWRAVGWAKARSTAPTGHHTRAPGQRGGRAAVTTIRRRVGKIACEGVGACAMRQSDFAHAVDFCDTRPRGQSVATPAHPRGQGARAEARCAHSASKTRVNAPMAHPTIPFARGRFYGCSAGRCKSLFGGL
jgi:hypothetical protein